MLEFSNYNAERTPSKALSIFEHLLGETICDVIICSWNDFSEKLFFEHDGALYIEFSSGETIGFGSIDEFNSVTVWLEKSSSNKIDEDSYFLFDKEMNCKRASLDKHSGSIKMINTFLSSVYLIKQIKFRNSLYDNLPNEVGIVFKLSNVYYLSITHYLFNKSLDFEVSLTDKFPIIDKAKYTIEALKLTN